MKIGKYDLIPIETCKFALDGGAMFGVVPKMLWQNSNQPDEFNRVTLHARCLLLKSNNKKILIDTGLGNNWDEKFMRIYNVDYSEFDLIKSLQTNGIKTEEITDVIFTHLHFDHTGGSTILENEKWMPAFPNAKYYVQKKHFDWALNPSEKDKASFVTNRFLPLYENGMINFIDGENNFDDEIQILISDGHTFSQQLIKISDSSKTLLFAGDLFPFTSHIPIPYITGYDLQPLVTIKEKKEILKKACDEEWLIFFEHDPFTVAATITKNEKGFSVKEKFLSLSEL
ncbi:MBL fold metallo-hydrolase [Rosettibacter firmus]|uniref:MBL fold metallo-hydrolase n=1 Tax=Rosettibacter firmus TaxID=3111522 RepID=UPI00336BF87F